MERERERLVNKALSLELNVVREERDQMRGEIERLTREIAERERETVKVIANVTPRGNGFYYSLFHSFYHSHLSLSLSDSLSIYI